MPNLFIRRYLTGLTCAALVLISTYDEMSAGEPAAVPIKKARRILLIGQSPDGHPWATHEYMAGQQILAKLLSQVDGVQTILVNADEPWKEGPELIDGADAVVIFVSQGAKWLHDSPARLAAMKKLAARGGGFMALHWGMGTQDAKNIAEFVKLAGGCHGGPDRKYKVIDVKATVATPQHPVMRGVTGFEIHEEFYYRLKFPKPKNSITPLLRVPIDGETHTVAWAWNRSDNGRSFGFSGLHFHTNWQQPQYRRMIGQAALWILKVDPPKGLSFEVPGKLISKPRPKTKTEKKQ
jgi:type 1 glutamine amidotransferase